MTSDVYTQSVYLIMQASHLYYTCSMSQQSIADQLGISVTTVSRLLKKAKEEQLVRYVIDEACGECVLLSEEIKNVFELKEVVIAPRTLNEKYYRSPSAKRKIVTLEGARYLQRTIQDNDVLGISWGRIVCDMLLYLNPAHKSNTKFVTLHGNLGNCIEKDLEELVKGMAKVFSGRYYYLASRALLPKKEITHKIKEKESTRKVFEMFRYVNISITGIGTWYPVPMSILTENGFLTAEEQKMLLKENVVGDIGLRFFDEKGEECKTELADRLLSIDLEQFKKIEKKIAVAAGLEKRHTIFSALKGGLIDVLIIDEELGRELLEINKNREK